MLSPNFHPSRGWFWATGIMKSVGTLGGIYSAAFGLNNFDQVVGASTRTDEVQVAFLWQNDQMTDLNTLLIAGTGWFLTRAWDIDDRGAMGGEGSVNGAPRAFLMTASSTVSAPPVGASALHFAGAMPNPMQRGGSFAFTLPTSVPARLDLYDASGRRIRALAAGTFGASLTRVPWDGRDEAGRTLEPGAYWARLELEGRALTRAFVVVR